MHERNGVCQFVVPDDADAAAALARELLEYLPQALARRPTARHPRRRCRRPRRRRPRRAARVYDVRDVVAPLVDDGDLLETAPRWARNMVCAFARIDGRPVGFVANQPRHLGGVIDAEAAQKAARFMRTCNAYGCRSSSSSTPRASCPARAQERAGVIRHGAKLVHAFAEATVPRVTVMLRKALRRRATSR